MRCIFFAGSKCPSMVSRSSEDYKYSPTEDETKKICNGAFRNECPRYAAQMEFLTASKPER